MSLLFALAVVVGNLPGVGQVLRAAVGEIAVEGILSRRRMTEIERLLFLGLPVEKSETEQMVGGLMLWAIPIDGLPEQLHYIAGSYLFTQLEINQLMTAIQHIDIARDLGGPFAQEFAKVVKKGKAGAAFRTSFQSHGVDVGKLLTHGRRRLEDPVLGALAKEAA